MRKVALESQVRLKVGPMAPAILVHGGTGPLRADDDEAAARSGCLEAARAGHAILMRGGSALDAVEAAARVLEDDPAFNAGTGAVLNEQGVAELDASLMEGTGLGAGAVAVVRTIKNPISAARLVMERSPHVLLVGPGAEEFAHAQGVPRVEPSSLITPAARQRWLEGRERRHGTIGAVAVDREGRLAAATSTGGTSGKLAGRVGDTPLIGCGTYADDRLGAVSCTGIGEFIIRVTLARRALQGLEAGQAPGEAVRGALSEIVRLGGEAGLILVTRSGELALATTAERMPCAWVDGMGQEGSAYRAAPEKRPSGRE